MIYRCCLCGTAYTSEAAAVKCVNKCGRQMHAKGKFQTKEANYLGETTTVEYCSPDASRAACEKALSIAESVLPRGVFLSIQRQVANWDCIGAVERNQLYDMILMMTKRYTK